MKKNILTILFVLLFCISANASRFTDNQDGTITDHKTGLMWMKNTAEKGMNWKKAVEYCEKINIAGYFDWRLPTVDELRSLFEFNNKKGCINKKYFPDTKSFQYWSCTEVKLSSKNAWLVEFPYGGYDSYCCGEKTSLFYVRAVRDLPKEDIH